MSKRNKRFMALLVSATMVLMSLPFQLVASAAANLGAPANVRATAGNATVTVTWDAVEGADGYKVVRSAASLAPVSEECGGTSKTFTNLTNGVEYTFAVYAGVNGEYSTASNQVTATPYYLAAPSGVSVSKSNNELVVTWVGVTGADKYEIQVFEAGTNGQVGGTYTSTGTRYTVSGVERNKSYYAKVRSVMNVNGAEQKSAWTSSSSSVGGGSTSESSAFNLRGSYNASTGNTTLTWNPINGASYYVIEYIVPNDSRTYTYTSNSTTATSSCPLGTQYRVKAYNAYRQLIGTSGSITVGSSSSTNSFTLRATLSGTTTNLSWNRITNASSYRVYVKYPASTSYTLYTTTSSNYATVYMSAGASFYVEAISGNYNVVIARSNYVTSGSGSGSGTSTDVSALRLRVATNGSNSLLVSWNAVANATHYDIYKKAEGDSMYRYVAYSTGTYATIAGTANDLVYVIAYNGNNSLVVSNPVQASGSASVTSNRPTNLKASINGDRAYLTWTGVNGATNYIVSYKKSTSSQYTSITIGNYTSFALTLSGLSSGTKYDIRIQAYNPFSATGSQYSPASDVLTISSKVDSDIPAPTGLKVVAGDKRASLSWNSVSGADGYAVYYRRAGASEFKKVATVTKTSVNLVGFTNGAKYEFMIEAIEDGEYGKSSSIVSATPKVVTGDVARPTGVDAYKTTEGKIRLTWDVTENAENYTVYFRRKGASSWTKVITTTNTAVTMKGFASGVTYEFSVVGSNSNDTSERSAVDTVKF